MRFVAIGDTGKGNTGQYEVAAAIEQKCQQDGCDFVQLLGDNIYDSGVSSTSDPQWQTKFEMPYANINLPFFVVLGNHDYGGNGAGSDFPRGQNEVDYTGVSTKWKLPSKYWHRVDQHVEFIGIDSNMMMYNSFAQQKTDIHNWIAASTATWRIAFGHHPYRSNGPHGNAGNYDNLALVPLVNGAKVKEFIDDELCGKVDLYISGHDHSRQWLTDTCNGTQLAVSGAGASSTELQGSNQVRFESDGIGFLYIKIEGRILTAEFIDPSGTVEFTYSFMK